MLIPILVTVRTRTITSTALLAIGNPKDWGTMAFAEPLRDEGISMSKTGSLLQTVDVGREGTAIVVVNADRFNDQDRWALVESGGDVVVVGAESGSDVLVGLTGMTIKGTVAATSSIRTLQRDDADTQTVRSLVDTRASVSL